MRFTAIDTSAWEELKKSIEELALCVREHFGTKPEFPDLLHNGDVCRILNISKRTLQHYRDICSGLLCHLFDRYSRQAIPQNNIGYYFEYIIFNFFCRSSSCHIFYF